MKIRSKLCPMFFRALNLWPRYPVYTDQIQYQTTFRSRFCWDKHFDKILTKIHENWITSVLTSWADPGFQKRGYICIKGRGFALLILSRFSKISHGNEIIFIGYLKRGTGKGFEWNPWTPSGSTTGLSDLHVPGPIQFRCILTHFMKIRSILYALGWA